MLFTFYLKQHLSDDIKKRNHTHPPDTEVRKQMH